ncbi:MULTISPECIES: alkaline phosphatase [Bacillaceae]|uniref:alkaline phosphatase n=1 Tax=Bacillaceae TaxID=186817 RepID=UPI0027D792CD|nr:MULTISPECIES: alkaline phosphatase [Bacillaceae]
MKAVNKKVLSVFIALCLLIGLSTGFLSLEKKEHAEAAGKKKTEVKNIIFMVGDGMGVPFLAAHRYMKDNPTTKIIENTTFDSYLVGMQTTYADDEEQNITDSASAATAMSSGVKTYNAAIAVDVHQNEVKTVLEEAKALGKSTGLVATSELTHATPASFGAHDISRHNMDQIADDYFDEMINGKHKVDVMLGGGLKNFVRTDRDLTEEFQNKGYSYVTNKNEMSSDKNKQILGLFADGGLPKMIDRTKEIPSLKEMTNVAINKLNKNKDGFFLLVEGSQIDWAAHDNDIVGTMSEMEDFEQAFKAVIEFAKKDKETLVVLTSDHSTGGYTMGANGEYNWFPEPVQSAKRTPDFMAAEIAAGKSVEETLNKYSGLELTSEELDTVVIAAEPIDGVKDVTKIDNAIENIYNARSNSGWTTSGHTGDDVAVFAYGPKKDRFSGLIDNTDQAKFIFDILEENSPYLPLTIEDVSSKSTKIKGMTAPGATISVKVGKETIGSGKANENGEFIINIKNQKAGKELTVLAKNKDKSSKVVKLLVK